MAKKERRPDSPAERQKIELPESIKRGGDIIVSKVPEPSAPSRLDTPETQAAPPEPPADGGGDT